jgi:protease IV
MKSTVTTTKISPTKVIVKPKLKWLTFGYFLFSIPSFLASLIWLLIAVIILGGVVFSGGKNSNAENKLGFETITQSKSDKSILIYNLSGAIDTGEGLQSYSPEGIYTEQVKKDFEKIKQDKNIEGVVFKLNTPGGTIFASEILGDLITDLMSSKNQTIPVFYYNQLVASGGLWASNKVKNSYIVGSSYGETGSIGVILTLPNFTSLADKIGYSETVIKSSGSKDIGNPLRQPTTEEKQYLEGLVQENYSNFIKVVASGRNLDENKVKEFANGYVFPNQKAKDFGLINEIGDIENAIKKVAETKNLQEYDVISSKKPSNPFEEVFLSGSISQILGSTQKVINKTLQLQPGTIYAIDVNKI